MNEYTVSLIVACTSLVIVLFKSIRKSRCTDIDCWGIKCTRVVIKEPDIELESP